MLPFLILLLATAGGQPKAALSHDGGVCAGLAWVMLEPGEKAFVKHGRDFHVYRFEGAKGPTDHWWGIYSGGFAQVRGNGPLLLQRDGVTIHRAVEGGQFRGYLAEKGRGQNHFFGSVFRGTSDDKKFFDRIDFSTRGQALCAKGR